MTFPQDESGMVRVWLAGVVGAAILIGAGLGTVLDGIATDSRPPVIAFERVEALNSPIRQGDDLTVRIWREKVRNDCPVTSIRTAVNEDGRVFEIPDAVGHEGGPVGAAYLDWTYPTDALPAGSYVLRVHLIYDCNEGGVFHYDQPEVRFRVKE